MAQINPNTKHKPEKTKVGEEVLDLVIPYIHNVDDRNSVSLVSRKFYEIDGITRKRLTVHTHYYPNPASLSKRFPFIESLTLRGLPYDFSVTDDYVIQITQWIQQIALEFRCLKELHFYGLVVHDEDLETLARTRGKDLRSLKIKMCKGFSTDGLMHVSKYCYQLRTFCLEYYYNVEVKDGIWLHHLALNSTVLEMLHVTNIDFSNNAQELTLLAKNCSKSLISLKIGKCYLSKLGDDFRYAVRLEHFGGYHCDEESDLVGFEFPQNMFSISIEDLPVTRCPIVFPYLNRIRKLKLVYLDMDEKCQCLLFKRCRNLEVLYTEDGCGDTGLQVIRTHLKNLRDLCICLDKKDGIIDLPLDNGVRAILMSCSKLERLEILHWHGGLTDVGLEYIGKYGANLRSLSFSLIGNSNAGLVKLSEGCPRLRKLILFGCPFNKQVVASSMFNIPTLRYVWFYSSARDPIGLALTRPEFQL
nr:hypothetical protein [Tanacetum cinerariifolium]